ncbi:hypothetical protein RJT34_08768 [Clitoria ternatea]|uniref:Uncharacterized protein n=1 Tax=Clitoria ternatea TaxID=43366 RepID=A0AAN9PUT7_CLITE
MYIVALIIVIIIVSYPVRLAGFVLPPASVGATTGAAEERAKVDRIFYSCDDNFGLGGFICQEGILGNTHCVYLFGFKSL